MGAPEVAQPGDEISLTFTLRNAGNFPAGATIGEVRANFSFNTVRAWQYSSEPVGVGEERSVGPLFVPIPAYLTGGEYWIEACAYSIGGDRPELNTANDCLRKTLKIDSPQVVDLTINSMTANATKVYPQISFPVTGTVTNYGNVEAPTVITILLSPDPIITRDDVAIAFNTTAPWRGIVGPGESATFTAQATIQNTEQLPGTYYIGACIGIADSRIEKDTTNNCTAASTIEVLSYSLTTDLSGWIAEVRSEGKHLPQNGPFPGDPFTLLIGLQNEGPASATNFEFSISWRREPGWNEPLQPFVQIRTALVDTMISGQIRYFRLAMRIPDDAKPGTYRFGVCVDTKNQVLERNENNCNESSLLYFPS